MTLHDALAACISDHAAAHLLTYREAALDLFDRGALEGDIDQRLGDLQAYGWHPRAVGAIDGLAYAVARWTFRFNHPGQPAPDYLA